MPGVNYTGGRRNAAKVRLRDVDARQQKTHFSHQRRSLVFNKFQEAAVPHGDGAHSIDLAHARDRFPGSTLGIANRCSSREYTIPQPQRIRPLATTISPRKSPSKPSTDDVNDPFETLRRQLMASSDLVGLNTNYRPTETRGQAYTGAHRRRPGNQEKREETVPDCSSSSPAPSSPSFRPAHALLDSAPFVFAIKSPNAPSSAPPGDPWAVLSALTDIDYRPDEWDLYTPRDSTYPAHDPLDIAERAGLDFRLNRDVTVDTAMLRSSDASSTTLCDDEVPQTAAYDLRSDSIPAQDVDESTSTTAAAPEDDIFDWLMEEDSDAESIKVEADQDFVQLPTSSLDSAYDPDQFTLDMELSGSPRVSFPPASVSMPLSSLTCAEAFPDETTEQPFFLDPFESPVPSQPSSSLTPSPPPPQPARSYPRQMASYSPVIVQPEATVPALDALVSMFSDCPDPSHRYESSSVVKVVRRDSSPRLLDIESVPTFDLVVPPDARSSPLLAHTAPVHDGADQVDGVLEDQKDTTEIDLVPQFSAFWEDEE